MERRYDYSPEFRAEAVKLVTEQGFSQSEAARRLSIPKGTIANWMAAYRKGQPISSAPGAASVADLERENAHLRKQLAQVQMEREILKKRRRTLQRSRCKVRVHEDLAASFSDHCHEPGAGGFMQWLLRLGGQATQ